MQTKREDQEEYWGKRKTSDEVDKPLDKESATNGREGLDKQPRSAGDETATKTKKVKDGRRTLGIG